MRIARSPSHSTPLRTFAESVQPQPSSVGSRTARVCALAACLALLLPLSLLLDAGSASANSWALHQAGAAGRSVKWFSRSAEMRDALRTWHKGKTGLSVKYARRAIRRGLSPEDLERALFIVCVGQVELDRARAALPHCNRAVRLSGGEDWRHINNRGNALLQLGRTDEAVADFQTAKELLSGLPVIRVAGGAPDLDANGVVQGNLDLALQRQSSGSENIANHPVLSPADWEDADPQRPAGASTSSEAPASVPASVSP